MQLMAAELVIERLQKESVHNMAMPQEFRDMY